MSEISFQTWICPNCHDDHLQENHEKCIKNLVEDVKKIEAIVVKKEREILKLVDFFKKFFERGFIEGINWAKENKDSKFIF